MFQGVSNSPKWYSLRVKNGFICFALLDFTVVMLLRYHLHFLRRRLTVEIRLTQQQRDLEDTTGVAGNVLKRPSPGVGLRLTYKRLIVQ